MKALLVTHEGRHLEEGAMLLVRPPLPPPGSALCSRVPRSQGMQATGGCCQGKD